MFEVLFLSSAHIERLNILKGKNTSALVLSIVVYFGCLECGSSYLIKNLVFLVFDSHIVDYDNVKKELFRTSRVAFFNVNMRISEIRAVFIKSW